MMGFLKFVFFIVFIYVAMAIFLRVAGVCPKYIDFMPTVVSKDRPEVGDSWDKLLWSLKLCPFSKTVY